MGTVIKGTQPGDSDYPSTRVDMEELETWEIGDPEPRGTHQLADTAHKRYREDMRLGRSMAESYSSRYILVDTLKPVGDQLKNLK